MPGELPTTSGIGEPCKLRNCRRLLVMQVSGARHSLLGFLLLLTKAHPCTCRACKTVREPVQASQSAAADVT